MALVAFVHILLAASGCVVRAPAPVGCPSWNNGDIDVALATDGGCSIPFDLSVGSIVTLFPEGASDELRASITVNASGWSVVHVSQAENPTMPLPGQTICMTFRPGDYTASVVVPTRP